MKLVQINNSREKESVLQMLRDNNLPADDLGENTLLFGFMDNESLMGTAGLEIFDSCALVRSVSMQKSLQGQGLGKNLYL
ncbi:MAG: hypothetical protein H0V30_02660 [Chitinophagaceae bacterium]|nr:hypothetical protein [Chitinophagaceae bacterium]